ncbi:Protein of unknown function [Zhouia amylolytica]|uniref:DUF4199 domain-containing protein n=1 Tax=Zhouia amylolytica TaxID=376730 RepID=A0A1I6QI07_9FLAO|nr:DUF4199 domain-containing protein [Zhouia amylolytica]MCQ0111256.1 DUF4199 domain-containing protein [Zhouia amylolytica]SFS52091.1 Protein of unknown function [Zhouia amylolytica]
MENTQPKTGKFALRFGLILGAISIVFSLMLFSLDMHYEQNTAAGIIGIVIMAAVVSIAIFQYRKANNNVLTLSQALKVGIGVALIAGVIGVIYQYLLVNVIDASFMEKFAEMQRAKLTEMGKFTSEEIDKQIEASKNYFWIGYPIALIMSLFFGFIVSLIAGLIMKKAPSEY